MKVLMLDAPQAMLDERRRLGLDGRDEMWDGVLHLVPPAGGPQQRLSSRFLLVVGPVASARDLEPFMETGLFAGDNDYRVPDQLYCRPEHISERGAEAAELVVEVRSSGDETYEKLPFYAQTGVREVLVLNPDGRRVELFRRIDRQMLPVIADASGGLRCDVLGIWLLTVDQTLQISWDGGSAQI